MHNIARAAVSPTADKDNKLLLPPHGFKEIILSVLQMYVSLSDPTLLTWAPPPFPQHKRIRLISQLFPGDDGSLTWGPVLSSC